MISKKTFLHTIDTLSREMEAESRMMEAISEYAEGEVYGRFVMIDLVLNLLAEAMHDNTDLLFYLFFDKDQLRSLKPGDVMLGDNDANIKSWEDVYDILRNTYEPYCSGYDLGEELGC